MPLNYASVDQNASRYAEQANNWLAESRKATGKLRSLFEEACLDTEGLKKTIEQARLSKPKLYLAKPLHEDLLQSYPLGGLPESYTLLTVDGSQIVPSRHRSLQFGLINIGMLTVRFGSGEPPATKLVTELLSYEEILRDDGNLISEEDIALIRDMRERTLIANEISPSLPRPVLTVTDGPLDLFFPSDIQGKKAQAAQREVFEIDQYMEREGILSAGYIDKPGSSMLHNMLDVFAELRGSTMPSQQNRKLSVRDRLLLADRILPGERSALFEIISKRPSEPADRLRVAFFYLNVSNTAEHPWLARVEIPFWLSQHPELVSLVHAALYNDAQVLDSHPYPYSLHRAHELAVVRQAEYEEIENLLLSRFPADSQLSGYRSNKDYLKGLK